jgi:hypothetical protein
LCDFIKIPALAFNVKINVCQFLFVLYRKILYTENKP